jgi:hypothetical protein
MDEDLQDPPAPVHRTKTGRILTEADMEALAREAEQGYDVSGLLAPEKLQEAWDRAERRRRG